MMPPFPGAVLTIFTLPTGVPAFQREGGLRPSVEGNDMTTTSRSLTVGLIVTVGLAAIGWIVAADQVQSSPVILRDQNAANVAGERVDHAGKRRTVSEVLDWNQIFIDTLIATNTANSSSQRLGAIVHTAIFDAYNGIERRYTPIFVHDRAPGGASRRAAVVAAAYTALVGLFPSQQSALDDRYAASLVALSEQCERRKSRRQRRSCTQRIERGTCVGNRSRAGRPGLARDRWVQRHLRCLQRRHSGWPVAADPAARAAPAHLRKHERAGSGLHLDVRSRQRDSVSA